MPCSAAQIGPRLARMCGWTTAAAEVAGISCRCAAHIITTRIGCGCSSTVVSGGYPPAYPIPVDRGDSISIRLAAHPLEHTPSVSPLHFPTLPHPCHNRFMPDARVAAIRSIRRERGRVIVKGSDFFLSMEAEPLKLPNLPPRAWRQRRQSIKAPHVHL